MSRRILLLGRSIGAYRVDAWESALRGLGFDVVRALDTDDDAGIPAQAGERRRRIEARLRRRAAQLDAARLAIGASGIVVLPLNNGCIGTALHLRRWLRVPVVSDLYVSMYDTLVNDRALVAEGSEEAHALRRMDRSLVESSDAVLTLGRTEFEHVVALVQARPDRRRVVVAPLSVPRRQRRAGPRRRTGPLNLAWWGSFIPLHGLDRIVAAMRILRERGVFPVLHAFGPDTPAPVRSAFLELLRTHPEGSIRLSAAETFQNGKLEAWLLEHCDLALGIFGESQKARHCVPNKVPDALSLGLPVLTMRSPGIAEHLDEDELVLCGNAPEAIADAIQRIDAGALDTAAIAARGHAAYERVFAPEHFPGHVEAALRIAGIRR